MLVRVSEPSFSDVEAYGDSDDDGRIMMYVRSALKTQS